MKKAKNTPNPHTQRRSVTSVLLAIFCLLFVWFLIWLNDWYKELFGKTLFGKKNTAVSKQTTASTAGNGGSDNSSTESGVTKYTTIEYQPIQNITQMLGSYGAVFKFATPLEQWVLNNKFGYVPTITLLDLEGNQIQAEIIAPVVEVWIEEYQAYQRTVEVITVNWGQPQAGFIVTS